eukprot:5247413-Pyramimonas_sp.AAC.1
MRGHRPLGPGAAWPAAAVDTWWAPENPHPKRLPSLEIGDLLTRVTPNPGQSGTAGACRILHPSP